MYLLMVVVQAAGASVCQSDIQARKDPWSAKDDAAGAAKKHVCSLCWSYFLQLASPAEKWELLTLNFTFKTAKSSMDLRDVTFCC